MINCIKFIKCSSFNPFWTYYIYILLNQFFCLEKFKKIKDPKDLNK